MEKSRITPRSSLIGKRPSRLLMVVALLMLIFVVGIVADTVLLLERYTVLTTTLDNAAISAAREIRAAGSTTGASETGAALDVARDLIELRGLDVVGMAIETCETVPELCADAENRKRVHVTADVAVNTVLLRFLGADVVTLSAGATAEIAALDLVILIDVSESMVDSTNPDTWARIGLGQVYVPPKWQDILAAESIQDADFPAQIQLWRDWLTAEPQAVSARLDYENTQSVYGVGSFPYPGTADTQNHPRRDCRVQFYPYSVATSVPLALQRLGEFSARWGTLDTQWQGFVPAYDYFGCCNDPTSGGRIDAEGRLVAFEGRDSVDLSAGDFDFSDLICEPFRKSREVVRQMVQQLDFEGGDRVAFVTFDRDAFVVDPDGANGGGITLCEAETQHILPETGKTTLNPMMICGERALDTLERHIGVRAEPNFYTWNEDGGGWTGFVRGANDYPVRGNCAFQNAALPNFFSLYSLWDWGEIAQQNGLDPLTYYPLSNQGGLYRIMTPDVLEGAWGQQMTAQQSYELWASCGGSNIGAALREGFNVLSENSRDENAVWAMVVVSDGVAGASDPVRVNGREPAAADPYAVLDELAVYPPETGDPMIRYGVGGEYGAFGLCPLGSPDAPTQLTRPDRNAFPFCSDIAPETRHFCTPSQSAQIITISERCAGTSGFSTGFAPFSPDADYDCALSLEENISIGNVYHLDIGTTASIDAGSDEGSTAITACDPLYDVDDYARDWADYITRGGTINNRTTETQRPLIYTIGIGLDFASGASGPGMAGNPIVPDPDNPRYTPGTVSRNPADYLGEELLRYLADVGDNFRVDTDYQQDWLDNFLLDDSADYGQRGACEDADVPPGTFAPLPPRTDCGNYFNNPDAETIRERLFADINSRLFIQLVTDASQDASRDVSQDVSRDVPR